MVTTNAPILACQNCKTNFTSVVIGERACCLKYGNRAPLSSAVSLCAKDGARPPLPTNAKQNADLLAFFNSKRDRSQQNFALDLNDVKTEGHFISSIGQKINFTNWQVNEPDNKNNNQDFVALWSDGLWNDYEGTYNDSVIICVYDCPKSANSTQSSSIKANHTSEGKFRLNLA